MKHYSPLTLLASSVLSLGLQAAVVETDSSDHYQVSESVSSVVYKRQQTTLVSSTPVPTVMVSSPVRSHPPLPLVALSEPTAKPTMPSVIIPTAVPVHPILNSTGLGRPEANEEQEEPSLFSVISDWFSVKPVKPWQKGTLAKKSMKPGGEVPEFDLFSEKVFAYKQGSIGGNGVGGGGCGCN